MRDHVLILFAAALLLVPTARGMTPEGEAALEEILWGWSGQVEELIAGTLLVTTTNSRVEKQQYTLMVNVTCFVVEEDRSRFPKLKEVRFLNKFQVQGWVFEDPLELCPDLQDRIDPREELILMGHTRTCDSTDCAK